MTSYREQLQAIKASKDANNAAADKAPAQSSRLTVLWQLIDAAVPDVFAVQETRKAELEGHKPTWGAPQRRTPTVADLRGHMRNDGKRMAVYPVRPDGAPEAGTTKA